jgi:hypothetical protein
MNMAAAVVDQASQIAVAAEYAAQATLVEQLHVGVAMVRPQLPGCLQSPQLAGIAGDEYPAGTIVAVDPVALDQGANDLPSLEHHGAEGPGSSGAMALSDGVDIPAVAVDHLAAIAATRAPADPSRLQHHNPITPLRQMQGGGEAGEAGSDDADVGADG